MADWTALFRGLRNNNLDFGGENMIERRGRDPSSVFQYYLDTEANALVSFSEPAAEAACMFHRCAARPVTLRCPWPSHPLWLCSRLAAALASKFSPSGSCFIFVGKAPHHNVTARWVSTNLRRLFDAPYNNNNTRGGGGSAGSLDKFKSVSQQVSIDLLG